MSFLAVGLDFNSAPIELREKLAVPKSDLIYATKDLIESTEVLESIIVSTCNRTEYYLHGEGHHRVYEWLCKNYRISSRELDLYTYKYSNQDGIRHLMSLASGLKSMVVGEVEILGQLKHSYDVAFNAGFVDKFLSRLFQRSFAAAKMVRTNTNISVNPISVAYAAVKLAGQIFTDVSSATVLVVGSGDTARLILNHLLGIGVKNIIIANRTIKKSKDLVSGLKSIGGGIKDNIKFIGLPEIPKNLYKADIVISSTASPLPIIGKGMVENALKYRSHKPICMIDVAMPRDIEPEVSSLSNIYLYCIDDLKKIVAENKKHRLTAAEQAKIIVENQVVEFMAWWESQEYVPRICRFRESFLKHREDVLEQGFQELDLGKDPYEVLNKITLKLVNKVMHKPTVKIRDAALNREKDMMEKLEHIFDI